MYFRIQNANTIEALSTENQKGTNALDFVRQNVGGATKPRISKIFNVQESPKTWPL